MARDTLGKLIQIRNIMVTSGRNGSFRRPVSYSKIEAKVSEWVRAKPARKEELLKEIERIVWLEQRPEAPRKKKTKTSVRVVEEE